MAEVIVRSAAGEQRFPLSSSTVSIGRERFNDIVIADPKASRKHAQIEKIGEQWMITDLGSSNGTFLRGERISQVLIHEGDTFTIGAVSMSFVGVEAAPSDDLAPTTMASAEELQARMARMQQQAQVKTQPTPPVAPAPPPAAQGMETVDLKAISAAAPAPAPAPAQFGDQQTVDLAALRASNAPPPPAPAPHKATDPEDLGTVAIMADQQKKAVSLQEVAPTAPPPMPKPVFNASAPPTAPSGLPAMQPAPQRAPAPMAPAGNNQPLPIEPIMLFLMRFLARIIDGVLMFPVMIVVAIVFTVINMILIKIAPPLILLGMAAEYLLIFGAMIAYEVYFVTRGGQTFGKRWMGLKIITSPDSGPLTTGGVVIRMIGYILSAIPCDIGLIWAAFDKEGRGWHDMMAKTRVIKVAEPHFDGFALP